MNRIIIIFMVAVLSGCIKISDNDIEPKKGTLQTQPVYIWGVQKMAVDPMQKGAGVYNDILLPINRRVKMV